MWLAWFDAKKASAFGISIAEYFAQRVPPTSLRATDAKLSRNLAEVTSSLHTQAELFRMEHKPNIYKTAKLANSFQWKLFDLGYDKGFVEDLTKKLLRNF